MKDTRIQDYLNSFDPKNYIPQLSLDFVIFTYHEETLKVLALKMIGVDFWVLPSGFVWQEEDLEESAARNLRERTGIERLFLRQFHTFGKKSRYFPEVQKAIKERTTLYPKIRDWYNHRFVTVGYYALVEYNRVAPQLDIFTEAYTWLDIDAVGVLAMDHPEIVEKAREILSHDLSTYPVGVDLLPEMFTLPELQKLYEAILGRPIDRGNFRKKILKENMLEKLSHQKTGEPHRSPYFYRFVSNDDISLKQEKSKFGF
ncbi:MAG: NUDIX domain-containing protein [Microscillaceae bacterium]|nr:NUDIX domain-containing protein [Microscillaceae bacterium]